MFWPFLDLGVIPENLLYGPFPLQLYRLREVTHFASYQDESSRQAADPRMVLSLLSTPGIDNEPLVEVRRLLCFYRNDRQLRICVPRGLFREWVFLGLLFLRHIIPSHLFVTCPAAYRGFLADAWW